MWMVRRSEEEKRMDSDIIHLCNIPPFLYNDHPLMDFVVYDVYMTILKYIFYSGIKNNITSNVFALG